MIKLFRKWFEQYRCWLLRRRMEKADYLLSRLVPDLVRFRSALRYASVRAKNTSLSPSERAEMRADFVRTSRRILHESALWATYGALRPLRDIRHQHLRMQLGRLINPLRMAVAHGEEIPTSTVPDYIRGEAAEMIPLIDSLEKFEGSKDFEGFAAA